MLSIFVPLFAYLLTAEQWYREGKWSPLGLRAGYIAAGLCPFVFSFGSRINPFVWISRIPHETWMTYHQWGARVIRKSSESILFGADPTVLFSLIHTGTMLHSKWDTMGEVWHEEGVTSRYFTKDGRLVNGTVAVVLMAWIIMSSFANLRRLYVPRYLSCAKTLKCSRSYELFVVQHVVSVLGLLVSLVAHLQVDLEQGVKYFYASAAAWGFSILIRLVMTIVCIAGIGRFRGVARMKELPGGVTQVDIETTGKYAWQAGQHVYLRLTKLNPFVGSQA